MRLDARKGDTMWNVFDVETCSVPKMVVWVDSSTSQWGRLDGHTFSGCMLISEHQERRIDIYPDRRLVLFNQVEDGDQDESVADVIREVCAESVS